MWKDDFHSSYLSKLHGGMVFITLWGEDDEMGDIPCKPLSELATQCLDGSTNDFVVTNG